MKLILKYLLAVTIMSLFAACSEEELIVNPELNKPFYEIKDGAPGSLDALAKEYFDRYGAIVLYDFAEDDIRWTWAGHWYDWYSPMKAGNERYAAKVLTFLKENFYERFTDDLVRRNLSYKIFVVDSLCSSVRFDQDYLIDVGERQNGMILSHAGPQQNDFDEARWNTIRGDVETIFMNGLFNSVPSKPSQFISLRDKNYVIPAPGNDPLGEYTAQRYRTYMSGWIKGWRPNPSANESLLQPGEALDFADYILFLIQTPATEIKHVMDRFPKVRVRVMSLVSFLNNILGLDVIATQNINCPDDSMPADFFQQF